MNFIIVLFLFILFNFKISGDEETCEKQSEILTTYDVEVEKIIKTNEKKVK
jgi:hypothetical protein